MTSSDADKVHLLRTDAEGGEARAQRHLANRYLRGRGVPCDPTLGAQWMQRAAQQGLATAQRSLGELYEQGLGVTRDLAQARHWYARAAAQGDRHAKAQLARLDRAPP